MPFTSAPGTFSGVTSEWLISHTTFSGSIINAGTIGAGGIVVISSTFTNGNIEPGTVLGGIRIDSSSKLFAASSTAVVVEGTASTCPTSPSAPTRRSPIPRMVPARGAR